MNQSTPLTLKGFRDFLPETMMVRNYVKKILIEVFESFGFQPLETPTLEYASVLRGKYGDEADKLTYFFKDAGDREVGLRYDLTVPSSRVLAANQLPLPFKRYQIQPVFRADNTQKGRYREFYQCDIDTFGSSSPLADAEIIAVIYTVLQKLNFKKYSIKINSRQVLFQIIDKIGAQESKNSVLQSLDKYNKIGQDGVIKELISKGIKEDQITILFDYIKEAQPDEYLAQVFKAVERMGVPKEAYQFDPTLVRGLDYYTGPIFETYVDEPKIGSITGGGRYDQLVAQLGGPSTPAVGTTLGFERIIDSIIELNLLPDLPKTTTKVMVADFGSDTEGEMLTLVSKLRSANINTLLYPNPDKLGKQFKYADSLGIQFVAMIGTDEAAKDLVTLKNMTTGEQKTLSQGEITDFMLKSTS